MKELERGHTAVAGLFAGIGGIELGLHEAGFRSAVLCESDLAARRVLQDRFAGTPLAGNIADLECLPEAGLVAAGFPCQDLSQAGATAGIRRLASRASRASPARSPRRR
jgi:DNA (cytosine-5)-methyltransferase 1